MIHLDPEDYERWESCPDQAVLDLVKGGYASLSTLLRGLKVTEPTSIEFHIKDHDWQMGGAYIMGNLPGRAGMFSHGEEPPPCSPWKLEAGPYVLTVGELSYFLIGQILNRDYWVVAGFPTRITVVSSPTFCPELADRVLTDLLTFTENDLLEQLIFDLTDISRCKGASARLSTFYPQDTNVGRALAQSIDDLAENWEQGGDDDDRRFGIAVHVAEVLKGCARLQAPEVDLTCAKWLARVRDQQNLDFGELHSLAEPLHNRLAGREEYEQLFGSVGLK